jgi:hypothetical protein
MIQYIGNYKMNTLNAFSVTLKYSQEAFGRFTSIKLLKGRSSAPPDILGMINDTLFHSFVDLPKEEDTIATPPINPVKSSVAIGQVGEQLIMDKLLSISKVNSDFEVDDTSNMTNHGDMAVRYRSKRICIECKNYSTRIPVKEITKYRKSLALAEYNAGIIIQLNPFGFAAQEQIRTPIDIRTECGKPSAYLTAIDLDLLYPIIEILLNNCDTAIDESMLDSYRKSLIGINERIMKLRKSIDAQKKNISVMEAVVDDIIKLSII